MDPYQKLSHLEKEIELFYSYFPVTLPGYNEAIGKLRYLFEQAKDFLKNQNQFVGNFHTQFNSLYFGLLETIRKFVISFLPNDKQAINKFDNLSENFNRDVALGNFEIALKNYIDAKGFFYLDIAANLHGNIEIWNALPVERKKDILDQIASTADTNQVHKLLRVNKEFHSFFINTQTYQTIKAQQIPNKNSDGWKEFVSLLKDRNNTVLASLERSGQKEIEKYNISRYQLIEIMFETLNDINQIKQTIADKNLNIQMQEIYKKFEVLISAKSKNDQIDNSHFRKSLAEKLRQPHIINNNNALTNLNGQIDISHFRAILPELLQPSVMINKNDILTALQVFIFKLAEALVNKADSKAIDSINNSRSFYFDIIINMFPIQIKGQNQNDLYESIQTELMRALSKIIQHLNSEKVEHTRRCLVM